MEEKIKFITEVLRDVGETQLSNKCGKYYSLVYDDDDNSVVALSFKGKYGYETTELDKLDEKTIDIIYNDLYTDFG